MNTKTKLGRLSQLAAKINGALQAPATKLATATPETPVSAGETGPQQDQHVADRRLALAGVNPGQPVRSTRPSRAKAAVTARDNAKAAAALDIPALPIVELTPENKARLDIATGAVAPVPPKGSFHTGGHGLIPAASPKEGKGKKGKAASSTPNDVAFKLAEVAALSKSLQQMADDGCPIEALTLSAAKRGKSAPLAKGAALPRSAPGREMAVPTPQTKAGQEAAAKKLGLQLGRKAPAKTGQRAQYAWKEHEAAAEHGTMPPLLDFTADTHKRFRPTLAEIEKAAKARDIKALKAIKINPVSSSPKAMIRWRDMCVAALSAKPAKPAKGKKA